MSGNKTENELQPGTPLGHYRVVSKIGAGGMGEVYLAEDTKLGRQVAIKFLTRGLSSDENLVKRFVQEAKAASALNHPHILTIYEFGEADGREFIVCEYVNGKTLRDHISHGQRLPLDVVFKVVIQIADALSAAHDAGIIHRDIKPENIILREDGYSKLVDFGLAKLSQPSTTAGASAVDTEPGLVMGTLAYMSPEQAAGKLVDTRSDIFSMGIVLYEMVTGRQPFAGPTKSHSVVAIIEKDPPPLASAGVDQPELERIIRHALEKRPTDRYQNAAELAADLRSLRQRLSFEEQLERAVVADDQRTKILTPAVTTSPSTATVAVLPFVNMSPSEDGDYFSDGLAEELLNVLAKIRGLRVAARTSAFSFKGKQTTIKEIGAALNVSSILEGSIRMAGPRVRISVQLVNVDEGYQIWSETYDRRMDDIFAIQDDIAGSVVSELRGRLLGEAENGKNIHSEVKKAVKGRSEDPEAQRLMLLGRHFLDRTTKEDTEKAIEYFEQAVYVDHAYALCWAELARAFSIKAGRAWIPVGEGFGRARDAVERALTLEPDLPEGHALLGRILAAHVWDLRGAQSEYERAVQLAPGNSAVLDGAAILAYKLGDFGRALELGRRALDQDPLSAAFWHNFGLAGHAAGDLDLAESAFSRALELVPQRLVSHALLCMVYLDMGRHEQGLEHAIAEPSEMWRCWALAIVCHAVGRESESVSERDKLIENYDRGNAYQVAEVCAARGEIDAAFSWLELAFTERDTGLTHAKVNPRLRVLHGDARWPELLDRIGFEGKV